jgi:hypothetical protein
MSTPVDQLTQRVKELEKQLRQIKEEKKYDVVHRGADEEFRANNFPPRHAASSCEVVGQGGKDNHCLFFFN